MTLTAEVPGTGVDEALATDVQPTMSERLLQVARAVCELHKLSLLVHTDPDSGYLYLSNWQVIDGDRGIAMADVVLDSQPIQPNFRVLAATVSEGSGNIGSMRVVAPDFRLPGVENGVPIPDDDPLAPAILQAFVDYLANPYAGTERETQRWWVRMQQRLAEIPPDTLNTLP